MTTQTTMEDWDDTPMYDPRATWPKEKSSHPLRITEVSEKTTDPKEGAATGWTIKKVQLEVANGDLAGKKLFMDFLVNPATKEDGTVYAKQEKIDQHMADGLEATEAEEKAQQGVIGFARGERQRFIRLMNAAGFIREVDIKNGDKNMRRIEEGVNGAVKLRKNDTGEYEIVGDDGNSTGTTYTDSMLVGKVVMGETAPEAYTNKDGEERMGRKVTKTWDYDPAEVGELAEPVAF